MPTHKNCKEVEETYRSQSLNATAYPKLCQDTCDNLVPAERALGSGLSVSQAICPTCQFKPSCEYHAVLQEAEDAPHRIATHQRASLSFEQLAKGAEYVAIHEDACSVLRPYLETARGFDAVSKVADQAITIVRSRQFGENCDRTEEDYFFRMRMTADRLIQDSADSVDTSILDSPAATAVPLGVDARLYEAMETTGIWPAAEPMQLVKLLAAGQIAELVIRSDEVFQPDGTPRLQIDCRHPSDEVVRKCKCLDR